MLLFLLSVLFHIKYINLFTNLFVIILAYYIIVLVNKVKGNYVLLFVYKVGTSVVHLIT